MTGAKGLARGFFPFLGVTFGEEKAFFLDCLLLTPVCGVFGTLSVIIFAWVGVSLLSLGGSGY